MKTNLNTREFLTLLKAGITGRSESETIRVRAEKILSRQVEATMASVLMIVVSNVLIFFALAYMLNVDIAPGDLLGWTIAVLAVLGLHLAIRWHYGRTEARDARRLRLWGIGMALASGLRALAWGAGMIIYFPDAELSAQMVIGVTAAAMMGGAAFALGPLPLTTLLFVIVTGGASMIALVLAGTPATMMLAVLTVVFILYLSVDILSLSRTFFGNVLGEIVNDEQKQTIGLLLKEFEDNGSDWLWHTNARGFFVDPNVRFAAAAGIGLKYLGKMRFEDLIFLDLDGFNRPAVKLFVQRKEMRSIDVVLNVRGEKRFWALTASPTFDDHGEFTGFQGVASDVTEIRAAAERLENLAHFDQLTGLRNRSSFLEALNKAIADDGPESLGIVLFDLTGFKQVNDTLGHGVGDELLARLGRRMAGLGAADRMFARLGGDEFALLAKVHANGSDLSSLAREVLDLFSAPFMIGPHNIVIDASAGVALGGRDGADAAHLMRAADLALYAAKSSGRGQLFEFNADLATAYMRRQNLERGLREAIDNDELSLRFQPIMSTKTGEVAAFEVLVRWQSAEFDAVGPDEFIPIAEESGLIIPIGNWILDRAVKTFASCDLSSQICVNVSPTQLRNENLVATVRSCLEETGLPPQRLVLEITEGVFLERNAQTDKTLGDLLALGVQIALDDFGTGYSSLSYLRSFPFSKIKIDKSFIDDIAAGGPNAHIVGAITDLADALGFEVVAEGVETHVQLAEIVRLGCGYAQGYLFSVPLRREEVSDFMDLLAENDLMHAAGAA